MPLSLLQIFSIFCILGVHLSMTYLTFCTVVTVPRLVSFMALKALNLETPTIWIILLYGVVCPWKIFFLSFSSQVKISREGYCCFVIILSEQAGAELCQALFQLWKLCQQYLYSDGRVGGWLGGWVAGWFNCDYIAKPQLSWAWQKKGWRLTPWLR